MDCGTLADLLERVKQIPEEYLAVICKQLLEGLAYIHHACPKSIIHRDLKPSNLLINRSGEVKISDFGVSATVTNIYGHAHTWTGTVAYMAPERINQTSYHDHKSDLWSLGLILLECAIGQFPYSFPKNSRNYFTFMKTVIEGPPPSAPDKFSPEFCDFISLCLQKDPKDRPSARKLLEHGFLSKYEKEKADLSDYFRKAFHLQPPETSVPAPPLALPSFAPTVEGSSSSNSKLPANSPTHEANLEVDEPMSEEPQELKEVQTNAKDESVEPSPNHKAPVAAAAAAGIDKLSSRQPLLQKSLGIVLDKAGRTQFYDDVSFFPLSGDDKLLSGRENRATNSTFNKFHSPQSYLGSGTNLGLFHEAKYEEITRSETTSVQIEIAHLESELKAVREKEAKILSKLNRLKSMIPDTWIE